MRTDKITAIMNEYDKRCVLYSDFTKKVKKLVGELLEENNFRVHSVTSRVKTRKSLQTKLARSEGEFSKLSDVTDISGIRIITYFADDIDSMAKMIEKEFDVDFECSIDKRLLLDPDRFGYLSLHYVVKLSKSRLRLTEYRRFADCQTEIQIRSILQHAWAEIEHDMGYKGKQAVPKKIRRRFSRLAGLLEIADAEFAEIRDSLLKYEKTVPKLIVDAPASVLIDKASLHSFVRNSPLVREIDGRIASVAQSSIVEDVEAISSTVAKLQSIGLETVADVDSSLREFGEIIVEFAKSWISPSKYETLHAGICLFYLCYVLVGRKKSIEEAYNYLARFGIGADQKTLAKKLISTYIQASK